MEDFAGMSFLLQAVLAFGGGVVAFLSPCVLPLVPGYLGLMSGYSVAELQGGAVSRRRMLEVTALFVAGFSAVFVATGAVATSLAQFLNRNQQVVDRIAGALVVGFAIVMIGTAFTDRGLFGFLARERRLDVRPSRLGALAPPVMGAAFGFGWTACIGPILAGLLALAGTQETVTRGMALLLVFSLGLGVPFVASALLLDKAFRATRMVRRWLRPIQVASGGIMLAFGVLLLTNQVSRLASLLVEVFIRVPLLDRLAAI